MELKNIGRYEIKKELGRGGMATVYHAFDPSFDREVAIKILPREFLHTPQFIDRFKREIKTIAQLDHPSIVQVYDVGEHDGIPYYVMRFMPGGSLSDMIDRGRFNIQDTARIVERLATGLSYAHRKGIVHRDLKPDNILFNEDGYPFISDFGIAKLSEAKTNLTGSGIIGTPAYMSPEQATGDTLDHRSDVYGLGVIVYQMLTGQQPFNADTPMGVAIKHVTDPVPDIRMVAADLPEEAGDVMKKVLAKNRDERYASAVEFARALNEAAFGEPGNIQESSPTVRLIEKAPPAGNKKLLVAGGIGLAVLLVLLVGGFLVFGGGGKNEEVPTATQELVLATDALPTDTAISLAPMCAPPPPKAGPALETLIQKTNTSCSAGKPYTTYSIPQGASFETTDPEFSCELVGNREGLDLVVCTGKPLFAFDLKVCMPVDTPVLDMNSNQCAEGQGFDTEHQCCALPPPEDAGCVIYKAGTTGCN